MSDKVIQAVSYEHFKHFCIENGMPGAEELTTDFLVYTGAIAGGAGGAITQPQQIKLDPTYDYFLQEIRASANHLAGAAAAAAIGAQAYIPEPELQHVSFNLRADGRTRSLFRAPIPLAQAIMGIAYPIDIAAPPSFSGKETVFCDIARLGAYNPQNIAAALDFTVTAQVAIIKAEALDAYSEYLKSLGRPSVRKVMR